MSGLTLTGGTITTSGTITLGGTLSLTAANVNAVGAITNSTSGNAATATALSSGQSNWSGTGVLGNVVGLLAWKNYSNSHVIFDASNSTTPSGGGCSNTNSTAAWTATYPTLMGWNGSTTYGVRVDSARVADSAGSATTATNFNNGTSYSSGSSVYADTFESAVSADWLELVYYGGLGVRIGTGANGSKALYAGSLYDSGNRVYSAANPQVNISGNAATAGTATNLSGAGGSSIQRTSYGTSYGAMYQMRETSGYSGNTDINAAPALGFHWGGIVASSILMETSGRISIRNNPGTAYENFIANIVYASASSRAPIFYDSDDTSYYVDPNGLSTLYRLQVIGNWSGANPNEGAINIRGAYPSMTFRSTTSNNMWLRHMDAAGNIQHYFANGTDSAAWTIKHSMFTNGDFYSLGSHTAASFIGPLSGNATTATTSTYSTYLNPLSGDGNYKLAYTADGARTNAGEWGRAVMYYVPNGQTYGIRVDRADSATTAGNITAYSINQNLATSSSPTFSYVYASVFAGSDYGALLYANNGTSYTQWRYAGSKNGYAGFSCGYSNVNGAMYDSSGNGGVYKEPGYGNWYWYFNVGNTCMGINGSATSSSYGLYVTGNIYTTGTLTQASDVRKKTDIVTIDNALEKVTQMRGVYFTKIGEEEKGRQTGVIAQEINEILPEVVIHAADVDEYSVAYGNAIGVLIEAIKELNVKLDEANKQIENLKQ